MIKIDYFKMDEYGGMYPKSPLLRSVNVSQKEFTKEEFDVYKNMPYLIKTRKLNNGAYINNILAIQDFEDPEKAKKKYEKDMKFIEKYDKNYNDPLVDTYLMFLKDVSDEKTVLYGNFLEIDNGKKGIFKKTTKTNILMGGKDQIMGIYIDMKTGLPALQRQPETREEFEELINTDPRLLRLVDAKAMCKLNIFPEDRKERALYIAHTLKDSADEIFKAQNGTPDGQDDITTAMENDSFKHQKETFMYSLTRDAQEFIDKYNTEEKKLKDGQSEKNTNNTFESSFNEKYNDGKNNGGRDR